MRAAANSELTSSPLEVLQAMLFIIMSTCPYSLAAELRR